LFSPSVRSISSGSEIKKVMRYQFPPIEPLLMD
jgi:hypothetical protein